MSKNKTRTNKNRSWTDEQLIEAVKNNTSVRQCVLKVGLKETGENARNIKLHIERLKLDISHFLGKGHLKGKTHNELKRCTIEEMMVADGRRSDVKTVKKYLIDHKVIEYKCAWCGTCDWRGESITLQIDHINGTPSDNRLENLRLLCPNCHSQTDTFCGRGIKNKNPRQKCIECNLEKNYNSYDLCEKCRLQHLRSGEYARKFKAQCYFDNKEDEWLIAEIVKAGSFKAFEPIAKLSRTSIKKRLKERGLLEKIHDELAKFRSPLSGKIYKK